MTRNSLRQMLQESSSLCVCLSLCASASVVAQPEDSTRPFFEGGSHTVGKHRFSVNNVAWATGPLITGSLWIGAHSGRDTLVSVGFDGYSGGREFLPGSLQSQNENNERMIQRSIADIDAEDFDLAKSEQDIILVYYDTNSVDNSFDQFDQRFHRPMNVRVKQSSYAWGFEYAENFVLVDYEITNLGRRELRNMYVGFFFDGGDSPGAVQEPYDWVHGFKKDGAAFFPRDVSCSYTEDLNIAWYADIDGWRFDPPSGEILTSGATSVGAVKILRPSIKDRGMSFNWWLTSSTLSDDFGPRKLPTATKPFLDYGGGLGTPRGDFAKYNAMSNREIDYDQAFTAVDHGYDGWLPPPSDAEDIADGRFDTHAVLATGPFDLGRGAVLKFTIAIIVGENFHRDPLNFVNNYNPYRPEAYYENLDFSDLIQNATWAKWVYDNPGVDTDGDGFRGTFRVCATGGDLLIDTQLVIDSSGPEPETLLVIDSTLSPVVDDTIWTSGDGIPDFRGALPPPSPEIRYTPKISTIFLEWNGFRSETSRDFFTQKIDFEGYRVYMGLVKRREDLLIMASYDIEDYAQWYFDPEATRVDEFGITQEGAWVLVSVRLKADIQDSYANGSIDYDPVINGIDNPLAINDSVFYFTTQDWNQNDLSDTTGIHKIFPAAPFPHTLDITEAFTEDTWYEDPQTGDMIFYESGELTEDGERFKFFEYRMILDNLLPSQPYFISVTAFDYGDPAINLPWLESNKVENAVEALAHNLVDTSVNTALDVIVYPNPYRIDGRYREFGFEGRGREDFPGERLRLVHFTNLPAVCDISIFSLDGDLIRTIEHRKTPQDPSAMHDSWDVISRNILPVVSGIYYWTVETPDGRTQIGKLVLIM